jgi:hypothetical protein
MATRGIQLAAATSAPSRPLDHRPAISPAMAACQQSMHVPPCSWCWVACARLKAHMRCIPEACPRCWLQQLGKHVSMTTGVPYAHFLPFKRWLGGGGVLTQR